MIGRRISGVDMRLLLSNGLPDLVINFASLYSSLQKTRGLQPDPLFNLVPEMARRD